MQDSTEIFKCDCHTEGILVHWDEGFPDCEDSAGVELAFWQMGHNYGGYNWRYRLRHIWRILKTGRPYTDMVMMKPDTAKAFAERILEIIKEEK